MENSVNNCKSFISSKDTEEGQVMCLNGDNMKFTSYNDENEVANKLVKSLCSKYQEKLETSLKGSDLTLDSVQLLYYKYHIVNFKISNFIHSLDQIKKKNATINPKDEDNKCFQYTATVALNYKYIESHLERVSNTKPFIHKYSWKGINYVMQFIVMQKLITNISKIMIEIKNYHTLLIGM